MTALAQAPLVCPTCGGPLHPEGAAMRCRRGHSFDVARQGYLNLARAGGPAGDDGAMVPARAEFLSGGWFDPLTAALARGAADAVAGPGVVADLGAGTGHHLAGVLDALEDHVGVALDASPYAARRAARAHPRAASVVADAWDRLPLADGSVALALVVFAPRSGAEIARVLAPGASLLVAAPAERHLAELAGPLGLLSVDPDKDRRLSQALEPELAPAGRSLVEWEMPLDRAAAALLAAMGPSARHLDAGELADAVARLDEPVTVTGAVTLSRWRAA